MRFFVLLALLLPSIVSAEDAVQELTDLVTLQAEIVKIYERQVQLAERNLALTRQRNLLVRVLLAQNPGSRELQQIAASMAAEGQSPEQVARTDAQLDGLFRAILAADVEAKP